MRQSIPSLTSRPPSTLIIAAGLLLALSAGACSSKSGGGELAAGAGEVAPSKLSPIELKKEKALSYAIENLLEKQHLNHHVIDDGVSKEAFGEFIEYLDPTKVFLLEKDVKALERHADKLDDQIEAGRLVLAEDAGRIQKARIEVVKKVVDDLLAKPLDLTNAETLEGDAEKRPWCKTEPELVERWRKVLELQALYRIERLKEADQGLVEAAAKKKKEREEALAAGKELPPEEVEADAEPPKVKTDAEYEKDARERLRKDYASRFGRLLQQEHIDLIEFFFNSIASIFDPHSSYLPPARKENFDISMSGSLEGIGAVLQEFENYIKIVRIVPGSASWRQGDLEAGDLILGVAQDKEEFVDVVDMRLRDVVKMIRGKKGTVVTLTVKKPDGAVKTIPITRDVVKIEESFAKGALLEHKSLRDKVGYIDLPSFYGNTRGGAKGNTPDRRCSDDVRKLLESFKKRGVKSVILDLRGNGGGLLTDAQRMSGLFIKEGPIVQTRSSGGDIKVLEDPDSGITFDGKVVVLVDSFSASASEILAGALQDYGRAVIVGTAQTHGKGTVQQLLSLDRMLSLKDAGKEVRPLGVFKITLSQFYRVNGESTQHRGVIPDIHLPDPAAYIESGERHYDHSIPWDKVEALEYEVWNNQSWKLPELSAASKARVAKSPAFGRVMARSNMLEARKKDTIESLAQETWRADREKRKSELEALTVEIDKKPTLFVAEPVDYDGALARQKAQLEEAARGDKDRKTGQEAPEHWPDIISKDIWLEEALLIIGEM